MNKKTLYGLAAGIAMLGMSTVAAAQAPALSLRNALPQMAQAGGQGGGQSSCDAGEVWDAKDLVCRKPAAGEPPVGGGGPGFFPIAIGLAASAGAAAAAFGSNGQPASP